MGKSGAALRAAKEEKKIYHWSRAELMEHDAYVRRQYLDEVRKQAAADLEKQYEKKWNDLMAEVDNEWERRNREFNSGDRQSDRFNVLRLAIYIPLRILIEEYGWKPCGNGDRRYKVTHFCLHFIDRVNNILCSEDNDIRTYANETRELYDLPEFDSTDTEGFTNES